jgi:hypothetical protein
MSMLGGLVFVAFCAAIIVPLAVLFVRTDREITQEEEERKARMKYRKQVQYWKDKALRSRTHIKVIGGGESEFILENRRESQWE